MTGAFVYRPGPAGAGWELLAEPIVKASLLPLTKTALVSNSFPSGRTTIGHVLFNGDYVILVHKDRFFAGRLIGAGAYEALGFDPFAVVAELPAADVALRAAVRWGKALAGTAAPDAGGEGAPNGGKVLWQAPSDTLAIALARTLLLAGTLGQRRATYFSLSLQGLPYRRSVLTRFVDDDGQPPPVALLAAARALPEAEAEALHVKLALPKGAPSERREQTETRQTLSSVRKPVAALPFGADSISQSATRPRRDGVAGAAGPVSEEGAMPPSSEACPPKAEVPSRHRPPHSPAAPWWLAPAATAAVALFFVAWIGNQTRLLTDASSDARTAAEAVNSVRDRVQHLANEVADSQAEAAKAAKAAKSAEAHAKATENTANSEAAEIRRAAYEAAANKAAAAKDAKTAEAAAQDAKSAEAHAKAAEHTVNSEAAKIKTTAHEAAAIKAAAAKDAKTAEAAAQEAKSAEAHAKAAEYTANSEAAKIKTAAHEATANKVAAAKDAKRAEAAAEDAKSAEAEVKAAASKASGAAPTKSKGAAVGDWWQRKYK